MSLLLLLFFISIFAFLLKRMIRLFYWSILIFGFKQTCQCSCDILGLYLYFSTINCFDVRGVSEISFISGEVSLLFHPEDKALIIISPNGIPEVLRNDFTLMSYIMNHTISWEWMREQGLDGEVMYYRYADKNKYGVIPVILTYANLMHYFNLKTINIEPKYEYIHWGVDHYYRHYLHGSALGKRNDRHHLPK